MATKVRQRQRQREQSAVAVLVDEYGELVEWMQEIERSERYRRLSELRVQILESVSVVDPEYGAALEGEVYRVEVGPKTQETTIDNGALFGVLGLEAFRDLARFRVGDLKDYTTVSEQETFLTRQRTGPRRVMVKRRESGSS